ncbi:MAG TPA: hypothetical protein VKD28_05875 [Gemmatimonadales bacterium]|nr:hypothetical protein [Gemmatimonadales bacterium]
MKPTSERSINLVVVALLVAPTLAAQGTHPNLYDRLQFGVSLTTVILNTNIRVDGSNGNGTDVDAEDDLGLETRRLEPRFAVRWRPGRRHELEVGYQFARRSSTRVLDRDITFGDSTYNVGGDVGTKFNSDQAFFAYRFAFLAKPRTQVGLAIGAGALFLDAALDAMGSGGQVQYSESQKITGPLGSLGLYGRFLSGDRWSWEAEARYVRISIDRFTAQVAEGGGAVRYSAWSHVTVEGGYGVSAIKLDIDPTTSSGSGSRSGRIKYSLQNIRLGVVVIP